MTDEQYIEWLNQLQVMSCRVVLMNYTRLYEGGPVEAHLYDPYEQRSRDIIDAALKATAYRPEKKHRQEKPVETPEVSEGGYTSPYQLPRCNKPADARDYPYLHASSDDCPLHANDRSIWREWYKWREIYATVGTDAERRSALESMLGYVTEDNPPEDHRKVKRPKAKSDYMRVSSRLLGVGWAFCLMGFITDIGGAYPVGVSCSAIAFVLFVLNILNLWRNRP